MEDLQKKNWSKPIIEKDKNHDRIAIEGFIK